MGAFRRGRLDGVDLGQGLARLGDLQGALRLVHLRAHLRPPRAAQPGSSARYNALRGYAAARDSVPAHGGHGHKPAP